ncbi:hypothetical protein AB0E59_42470 [Lentzea sp. NPDC034063]
MIERVCGQNANLLDHLISAHQFRFFFVVDTEFDGCLTGGCSVHFGQC